MRATLCLVLLALSTAIVQSAEPYTVILKNGKVLKGQLLSENDELIVFKDEQGLQYSLKKTLVNLEKTREVNQPPAPPPEPVSSDAQPEPFDSNTQQEPAADKPEENSEPAPVTQTTSETSAEPEATPEIPPPVEAAIDESSQDPSLSYYTTLLDANNKLEQAFQEVGALLDGMLTAWEVNASTGRDPAAALQEFRTTKGAAQTTSISAKLQVLQNLRQSLNDPPVQYSSAFDTFTAAIGELTQYYDAVGQYSGKPGLRVFHSRLNSTEQSIQKKIDELKAVKQ